MPTWITIWRHVPDYAFPRPHTYRVRQNRQETDKGWWEKGGVLGKQGASGHRLEADAAPIIPLVFLQRPYVFQVD